MPSREPTSESSEAGPDGWANWRAFLDGHRGEADEYAWYSDGTFVGEALGPLGPYELLNALPVGDGLAPRLVLRAEYCRLELIAAAGKLVDSVADDRFPKTDVTLYHGGGLEQELAALVSLAVGVRVRSGGRTRHFSAGDARGSPIDESAAPYFSPARGRSLLPFSAGQVDIDSAVELLSPYPRMSGSSAIALVRAARAYQQALWVADSDPTLSWLYLVTAAEVAAKQWAGATGTDVEWLAEWNPGVAKALLGSPDEVVAAVARQLKGITGALRAFREFVITFLPGPPDQRPPDYFQLNWDREQMRAHLNKVYNWRSKALHESTPMPVPMCIAPYWPNDWSVPAEVPAAEATYGVEGVWNRDDCPMLLWTFEYIVRAALLRWWGELAGPQG
jgi:hypothetical protein